MNILIVGPYPPPYGGISSLIRSLVEGFKDKDVGEVVILYFGAKSEVRLVDGAIVYEESISKNSWRILSPFNWHLILPLVRTYSGKKFSVREILNIYIKAILTNNVKKKHNIKTASFYQTETSFHLLLCREIWKQSVSIILNVFGELYDATDYLLPKKNLLLQMLYCSDSIISSSCYCADSFKMIGNERKIDVIYVGVSVSRFSEIDSLRADYRVKLGISEESSVLLFMGRFNKEMGLHSIIDLFPNLITKKKEFHLILAGASGELNDSARDLENKYSKNVTVMNDIPFEIQPNLYAASDIVLAPSRDKHACMGVSIKEAMAASLPVIASDSGGIPEAIIHDETGIIVPLMEDGENNLEDFENAILELSQNKSKMEYLAKNSLKRAKEIFSEEETLDKTYKVFMRHAKS